MPVENSTSPIPSGTEDGSADQPPAGGQPGIRSQGGARPDVVVLDFDDNQLVSALAGVADCNLARIEQLLGVTLTPRGNRVAIRGDEDTRGQAARALGDLYGKLKRGQDVVMADVDGAVRMATSAMPEARRGSASVQFVTKRRVIEPRSANQAQYMQSLQTNELVFGIGPAGTGKTYLAVAAAVSLFIKGQVDRIILSRPAVEAGERLGFLPGDLRDKIDPYLRPLYDALYDTLPAEQVARSLESGEIEVAPLAFMRGRTLSNSYVILDEAQNCTSVQMRMFLTRLGENSRMAITGDPTQVDLPMGAKSGLREARDVLRNVPGVAVTEFANVDVVRHPLVTRIVDAYSKADGKRLPNLQDSGGDKAGDTGPKA
ncbi:phosphate starvation protein PhoH [Pyruvatibacter mobilis]|nr:phosphate starvation protein PhoH [Pyruvatibacter mobilis]